MTFISAHTDGPALPGMLTVRGVTRPASLLIEQIAVTPESFTAGGTMHIDRAEFGVTAYRALADRYLGRTVEVRCVRK
jgi:polyisoprenoid-binding protein YceI